MLTLVGVGCGTRLPRSWARRALAASGSIGGATSGAPGAGIGG